MKFHISILPASSATAAIILLFIAMPSLYASDCLTPQEAFSDPQLSAWFSFFFLKDYEISFTPSTNSIDNRLDTKLPDSYKTDSMVFNSSKTLSYEITCYEFSEQDGINIPEPDCSIQFYNYRDHLTGQLFHCGSTCEVHGAYWATDSMLVVFGLSESDDPKLTEGMLVIYNFDTGTCSSFCIAHQFFKSGADPITYMRKYQLDTLPKHP